MSRLNSFYHFFRGFFPKDLSFTRRVVKLQHLVNILLLIPTEQSDIDLVIQEIYYVY